MQKIRFMTMLVLAGAMLIFNGCHSGKISELETKIASIQLGQGDFAQVSNWMDQKGVLNTSSSLSVMEINDGLINNATELALVSFDKQNSIAIRTVYAKVSEDVGQKRFKLMIKSIIPEAVLNKTYVSNTERMAGIVDYMHKALIADGQGYSSDKKGQPVLGAARHMLDTAKRAVSDAPRQTWQLESSNGLEFNHMNMGKSRITLNQQGGNIFILRIDSSKFNDPLVN